MKCPKCGFDDTEYVTVDWGKIKTTAKTPMSEWIKTDTDIEKLLLEYERAKAYLKIA